MSKAQINRKRKQFGKDEQSDEKYVISESAEEFEVQDPGLPFFDKKILKTYRQRNYAKCIKLIDRMLMNNTDEDKTHYKILQAASYTMIGEDFSSAHQILDEVLVSDPENSYAAYNKGVTLYFEKKLNESVQMFNKAIEMNPQEMERAKDMKMRIDLQHRKAVIMVQKICNDEKEIEAPEDFDEFLGNIKKEGIECHESDEVTSSVIEAITDDSMNDSDNQFSIVCDKLEPDESSMNPVLPGKVSPVAKNVIKVSKPLQKIISHKGIYLAKNVRPFELILISFHFLQQRNYQSSSACHTSNCRRVFRQRNATL